MVVRILLDETREADGRGQIDLRVVGGTPGKAMFFGLKVIDAPQPLSSVIRRGQHVPGTRKLHRSAVNASLWIDAERYIEGRASASQDAKCAAIQIEPRVGWK